MGILRKGKEGNLTGHLVTQLKYWGLSPIWRTGWSCRFRLREAIFSLVRKGDSKVPERDLQKRISENLGIIPGRH